MFVLKKTFLNLSKLNFNLKLGFKSIQDEVKISDLCLLVKI